MKNKTPSACLACPRHEVVFILSVSIHKIVFIIVSLFVREIDGSTLFLECKKRAFRGPVYSHGITPDPKSRVIFMRFPSSVQL